MNKSQKRILVRDQIVKGSAHPPFVQEADYVDCITEIEDARDQILILTKHLGCDSLEDHGGDACGDLYSDLECLRQLVALHKKEAHTELVQTNAALRCALRDMIRMVEQSSREHWDLEDIRYLLAKALLDLGWEG